MNSIKVDGIPTMLLKTAHDDIVFSIPVYCPRPLPPETCSLRLPRTVRLPLGRPRGLPRLRPAGVLVGEVLRESENSVAA